MILKRTISRPSGFSILFGLFCLAMGVNFFLTANPYAVHHYGGAARWTEIHSSTWAFNPFYPFSWRRYLIDRHIEAKLLKNMDNIIVTNKETADGYIKHYPFLDCQKFTIIPAGYDYKEVQQAKLDRGKKFRIVYTGIFCKERNPEIFFKSITNLNIDFEMLIAGEVSPQYIKIIKNLGLNNRVKLLGYQSHERALALQKGADILLLLGWSKGYQIPAKTFEYFWSSPSYFRYKI